MLNITLQETKTAEEWVNYDENFSLKIRAVGYEPYQAAIEYISDIRAAQRTDIKKADKTLVSHFTEAIAAHLIVDWKGLGVDGEELPYTAENAQAVLQSSSIGDKLFSFIIDAATNIQLESQKKKEAVMGKSSKPTNGSGTAKTKAQ